MPSDPYWDEHWDKRRSPDGKVLCNTEKAKLIIGKLWALPWLVKATKFEVGCGPCNHVRIINGFCDEWGKNYKGIDISEKAVAEAKAFGVNAEVGDICSYSQSQNETYEIILILDTLEHIENHAGAAKKIKSISHQGSRMYGNVPLYFSDHRKTDGVFERPIDIVSVDKFVRLSGFYLTRNHVYGIDGWPYMWFEAKRD